MNTYQKLKFIYTFNPRWHDIRRTLICFINRRRDCSFKLNYLSLIISLNQKSIKGFWVFSFIFIIKLYFFNKALQQTLWNVSLYNSFSSKTSSKTENSLELSRSCQTVLHTSLSLYPAFNSFEAFETPCAGALITMVIAIQSDPRNWNTCKSYIS